MKETLKLGIVLLIITVVSAGILAVSNNFTKDKIAQLAIEDSLAALQDIFGDGYEFRIMDADRQEEIITEEPAIVEILEAYSDEVLSGYAIKTVTGGYAGDLIVLTGISIDQGEVLGMKLLEHGETPTLGGKATQPEFEEKFPGKSIEEEVTVEGISGATVTSKGVMKGVNIARELYNNVLSN